jgi:tetratricopeptide (TPR) repeat protein
MSRPNNPSVQIALANIYQRSGRHQRALAILERMSDLQNPEYNAATTWMLKGAALASLGRIEESRACLREASERSTNKDQNVRLELAQLQAKMGDLADARANLGRVLSQEPNNPAALNVQHNLEKMFQDSSSGNLDVAASRKVGAIPTSGINQPPIHSLPKSGNETSIPFLRSN